MIERPCPTSPEQCPNASGPDEMLLDTALNDIRSKEWMGGAGRAPAIALERASGTTEISSEDLLSSHDPVVPWRVLRVSRR